MTNRERVEATTGKGTCGEACHMALFNPLGYAFENYDAIGKYRTVDHGQPVDAASSLHPRRPGEELRQRYRAVETHLRGQANAQLLRQNMMTYLHGRLLADEDQPLVDYYARVSRAGQISLHDLELAFVTREEFLNRLP